MRDLCILTPDPAYEENWPPYAAQYAELFDGVSFRPWTDRGNLTNFALVLPLMAWGYQRAPERWYAALDDWEQSGARFRNQFATLRWNTDKSYLLDLEAAGIAIVPTRVSDALCEADLATARTAFGDTLVVKPAISGGADGTYRIAAGDPLPPAVAGAHMLIQPLVPAIASEGEFSLFHFGGRFSHAILKVPAAGDFRVQEQFGGREHGIDPPAQALALADAALAAAPAPPLYARSDMVRDAEGRFRLMELELIEPSLFFDHAPDRGRAFGEAVKAALVV